MVEDDSTDQLIRLEKPVINYGPIVRSADISAEEENKAVESYANSTTKLQPLLRTIFEKLHEKDPGVYEEAVHAAEEMKQTPFDLRDWSSSDQNAVPEGLVSRRAPVNPFHSPFITKLLGQPKKTVEKVKDPALNDNPLRGRLVATISVNLALLIIFILELFYNHTMTGSYYAPYSENSFFGPVADTLSNFGGLNSTLVRGGQWYRLFSSWWLHAGWLHIMFNVLCQLQYMYMMEPDWGSVRLFATYAIAALTGSIFSMMMDPCKTTVGSSGGLFGLLAAIVPYSIEYWLSIPRPMILLIFNIIVLVISVALGFSSNTDNWSHIGGIIGGLAFSFMTINKLSAFHRTENREHRLTTKANIANVFQRKIQPGCRCGVRENSVRIVAFIALVATWVVASIKVFVAYEYQPLGSLTFSGVAKCCCCYDVFDEKVAEDHFKDIGNWKCYGCDLEIYIGETWDTTCQESRDKLNNSGSKMRLLEQPKYKISGRPRF